MMSGQQLHNHAFSLEKSKKKKEDVKKAKQKKPGQKESQKERRAGVDEQPAPPMVKKPPTREPMSSESRGGAVEGQRAPRRNAFEERPYEPEQYYQENFGPKADLFSNFKWVRGGKETLEITGPKCLYF